MTELQKCFWNAAAWKDYCSEEKMANWWMEKCPLALLALLRSRKLLGCTSIHPEWPSFSLFLKGRARTPFKGSSSFHHLISYFDTRGIHTQLAVQISKLFHLKPFKRSKNGHLSKFRSGIQKMFTTVSSVNNFNGLFIWIFIISSLRKNNKWVEKNNI